MTWIVGIVKFRNTLIHECKLVPIIQLRSKMTLEEIEELEELDGLEEGEAGYPISNYRIVRADHDLVASNTPIPYNGLNVQ